jgi:hypothetical protein
MSSLGLDPNRVDGLTGDQQVQIVITVHAGGAMSVTGPVHDPLWILAALEHARDAVKGQFARRPGFILPDKDVSLPGLREKLQ